MNIHELENMSSNYLSSFEGDSMFEGDAMAFDGAGGFERVPESFFVGRNYTLTITNSATDDRTCYILPGLDWYSGKTANGYVRTGGFKDINGNEGLVGAGSPTAIELFYSFFQQNPTQIVGIKVSSSISAEQVQETINFQAENPFYVGQTYPLDLGTNQTDMTYRDKVSGPFRVPSYIALSGQMKASLTIKAKGSANNVVKITFYCGAVNNQSVKVTKLPVRR